MGAVQCIADAQHNRYKNSLFAHAPASKVESSTPFLGVFLCQARVELKNEAMSELPLTRACHKQIRGSFTLRRKAANAFWGTQSSSTTLVEKSVAHS